MVIIMVNYFDVIMVIIMVNYFDVIMVIIMVNYFDVIMVIIKVNYFDVIMAIIMVNYFDVLLLAAIKQHDLDTNGKLDQAKDRYTFSLFSYRWVLRAPPPRRGGKH